MELRIYRTMIPAAVILLTASGCAEQAFPSSSSAVGTAVRTSSGASHNRRSDMRSILKGLTKDVVIGSTVDANNGDQGPRSLYIVQHANPHGKLTTGQLVTCNFEDASGNEGAGTTIEALNPKPGSDPQRFIQSSSLDGCNGAAVHPRHGTVYGTGLTSGKLLVITAKGNVEKTYSGKPIDAPLGDIVAKPMQNFSPLYVFVGTTHGALISVSVGFYGNQLATEVAKGFEVGNSSDGEMGPTGLAYDQGIDTLYIADGVTNTVVAFSSASKLLVKDEIVVQPGGKTFKCKYPKTTCGSLVYSGSPLDAPMAMTLLPNGNLIVANTQGSANTLVEFTPGGQILATKVVGSSSQQGVFGLASKGTNDDNTVVFYTDTNDNNIHELKP